MAYTITEKEFERFRALVYKESGISLGPHKQSFLVSRLAKRLHALDLRSFQQYYELVTSDPSGAEFARMLDLISTNKTEFFREPAHFEFLRDCILPELKETKQIRVWSSACATGEEPYSIAITLFESVTDPTDWSFRILASDLSTRVLEKAANGMYEEDRIRHLPTAVARRHFLRGKGARAGLVRVKPHLAAVVKFRRINLMNERFPIKSPLDVIFCRNAMIYFDRPTQEAVVKKFCHYLKPRGYLFIGHSETLQWVTNSFEPVAPTIYRKAG